LPFTTLLLWAFGMGAAAALSGVHELRVSPRPFLLSDSFAAFVVFMLFLLLPASLYFYVFHGDWFMLYLVDVRRVPSPLVPLGLFAEFVFGVCGFAYAAICVRAQHSSWVAFALLACVAGALSVLLVYPDRLQHVGTLRQFQGGFGLARYGGALMQGGLAMGGLLAAGSVFLVYRIRRGQARILRP
jgi:phosphoglycerol transferase MdoB-like AlkP superfamily enzyme